MDIFMRFPGGRRKALTFSYDDGTEQDIRFVEILKQHGMKGTFNLNSGQYAPEGTVYPVDKIYRRMTQNQTTETFADTGMEVAIHGFVHPHLERLSVSRCLHDVMTDRENLEQQFGTIIRGMAYPYGTYNDQVIECLKMAGIQYSRTIESTQKFDMPADWYLWNPTCHHADPELMNLAKKFAEGYVGGDPWLFYVWGHTYEFDVRNNWGVIEEFAEYIGSKDDIWYATNMEICEYTKAYQRLIFSIDDHRVYNPTAYTIWFEEHYAGFEYKDSVIHCIKPGEQIII